MVPIILAIGAVGVVGMLVWGPLSERLALNRLKGSCAALRAELATLQTQGADIGRRLIVQSQLDDCQAALVDAGVPVDAVREDLHQVEGLRQRIRQEWTHYRSTDWVDGTKRGNIYGAILRLGEEMVQTYRSAFSAVENGPEDAKVSGMGRILASAAVDMDDANERSICHYSGGHGCGVNVGGGDGEKDRIVLPLMAFIVTVREALAELGGKLPARVQPNDYALSRERGKGNDVPGSYNPEGTIVGDTA